MAKLNITKKFEFASSHFLENYKGKCENMHGHNYKLLVSISGEVKENGLVMDFKDIKKIVEKEVINKLDHKHLNDIIKNASAENIAVWIWNHLKNKLPLKKITLFETDNCFVEYEG